MQNSEEKLSRLTKEDKMREVAIIGKLYLDYGTYAKFRRKIIKAD